MSDRGLILRNSSGSGMLLRQRPREFDMNDSDRISVVLQHIAQVWRLHPEWRLGQLVCNVAAWHDVSHNAVWDIDDETLVSEIERHVSQYDEVVADGGKTAGTTERVDSR